MKKLIMTLGMALAMGTGCGDELAGEADLDEADPSLQPEVDQTASALGNACKDVSITIHNRLYQKIKVLRVKAHSVTDDTWRSEDLPNAEINPLSAATWSGVKLEYLRNDTINAWRVYFKVWFPGSSSWSSTTLDFYGIPDTVCREGSSFHVYVNSTDF